MFVSAQAAVRAFAWPDAIAAIQAAYTVPADPTALPPRTVARAPGVWLRCLPAIPANGRYFGAKLMGMAPSSTTPGVDYVIVLFDRETSGIAAFVDANLVTGYRTASTTAAALDRLVPREPVTLAILGSGLEATMHLRAFASIREIGACTVFSPTPHKRDAFAQSLGAELGIDIRAVATPAEGVREAGVVLAAARSRGEQPILFGNWLRPDATILSIGSTVPEQRELDASVIAAADLIVCDTLEEVIEETGDMLAAAASGVDTHGRCFGMDQLMAGALDARIAQAGIRMFKSVGAGLQDVVIAEMILTRALEAGLATPLPIQFDTKRPQKKG
ncbi:ornithine cyclodeaminase family protein [Sphingomonas sp.]|uniref:ornithine cyclodeaminase family protein n=1 Tax=Sphingomonas sp. TaxID=28214 RepID=UPI0025E8E6A4|nr:ornithine cyclodeaminase family protein [Sphingomonas sp.]